MAELLRQKNRASGILHMKTLSSLALRLISSAILIPAVVIICFMGGWTYGVFIALVIGIAFSEWVKMALLCSPEKKTQILCLIFGFFYLGSAFIEMSALRLYFDEGAMLVLGLFVTTWASDSTAYLFGKTIGGPKMCPLISPNKTWAGLAGSVFGAGTALLFWNFLFLHFESQLLTFVFGAAMGIVGQAGDLMISYLKRKSGLKDTGALIPGHGGIMDRIDAMLLILPFYIFFCLSQA